MARRLPPAGSGAAFNLIACTQEDLGNASRDHLRLDYDGALRWMAYAEEWFQKAHEALKREAAAEAEANRG